MAPIRSTRRSLSGVSSSMNLKRVSEDHAWAAAALACMLERVRRMCVLEWTARAAEALRLANGMKP